MAHIIAIASGKGGVGKSVLAANISYCLAKHGARTVLIDLDCGAANAHTILGVKNNFSGIGQFIYSDNRRLSDFVTSLSHKNFSLIQGDGLLPGTANLPFIKKKKLLKEIQSLDYDYVVLDLGAGTQFNIIDFFLVAHYGFLVVVPEPTSMLNAYAFIKTALFRLYSQLAGPKSEVRGRVGAFFTGKMEDLGKKGIAELDDLIRSLDPKSFDKISQFALNPKIVVNMLREPKDLELSARLRQVCQKQLGVTIEFSGIFSYDDQIRHSIIERKLLCDSFSESRASKQIEDFVKKILAGAIEPKNPPINDFSDLEKLYENLGQSEH